jgi:hypothetical protein
MSKKDLENGSAKKQAAFAKINWITYDLNSEDKVRLEDQGLVDSLAGYDVDALAFEGFKYSLSPDAKNSSFIASITDKSPESRFYNSCLSGRGSSPANARISLLYRHVVLAEGNWEFFGSSNQRNDSIYS